MQMVDKFAWAQQTRLARALAAEEDAARVALARMLGEMASVHPKYLALLSLRRALCSGFRPQDWSKAARVAPSRASILPQARLFFSPCGTRCSRSCTTWLAQQRRRRKAWR